MGIGLPPSDETDSGSDDDRVARDGVPSAAELLVRAVEALERMQDTGRVFFTTEEIARQLNITSRGVRQMMDRGELPWATLGRQRVVPRAALLALLAEQVRKNEARQWPA